MGLATYGFPSETNLAAGHLADYSSQLIEKRLIGVSRWAEKVRNQILYHASHNETVNLEGEPGTGKSLVAALIHQCSARREGPFVTLSFSSASVDVAHSILFGPSTGSSTGSLPDEQGLIELAHGGTIYLKGFLHSTSWSTSTESILNMLELSRIDGRHESGARILLGWTTRSGFRREEPGNGKGIARGFETIAIPPLRERPEDVDALALHFVKQHCLQDHKELRTVSPVAMQALCSHDWPGNVLELRVLVRNLVKQASPPPIDISLLPAYVRGGRNCNADFLPASGLDLSEEVKRREMELIQAALKQSHGMQAKAAKLLRIKPTTLFMKIQRYKIDVDAFREY